MPVSMGTTLIVGVGPGLGAAVARRFAAASAPVALAARSSEFITDLKQDLSRQGYRAIALPYDASEESVIEGAIAEVEERLGPVQTLVYNVGSRAFGGLEAITPQQFMDGFKAGPYGAFLHTRLLIPAMAQRGGGTVIFTGATSSVRSPAHSPAFGSLKFGMRGLAMSLSRAWAPKGVHVAHVIVDGSIGTPQRIQAQEDEVLMLPQDIAETYYQLAVQPRSAWTFEIDLRPYADDLLDN